MQGFEFMNILHFPVIEIKPVQMHLLSNIVQQCLGGVELDNWLFGGPQKANCVRESLFH